MPEAPALQPSVATLPLRATAPLPGPVFDAIRRRLVLHGCKWDPQVGDMRALAPFALVMTAQTWSRLAGWAEALAAETAQAEAELLRRPELHGTLAVPKPITRALAAADGADRAVIAPRIIRFDFHWTSDGWRISEINSDVPGGFAESSIFPRLMAGQLPGLRAAGDPASHWADAVVAACQPGVAALLAAPGYMEDQQVVAHLAKTLRDRGLETHVCQPHHVRWSAGRARLCTAWADVPIGVIVRFYQGEWVARLRARSGWRFLLAGGQTPVVNPGCSVLTESKRFPLVWPSLRTPLPAWQRLLPETRDPRNAPWPSDDRWLLKSAFCNNGDQIANRRWHGPRLWRSMARAARWSPGQWIAQRLFHSVSVPTPDGPMHVCIGVYVMCGKAAGAYGRMTRGITRAVLMQPSESQPQPDLAHTLRGWQDAGIHIALKRLDGDEAPTPLSVNRPAFYRHLWRRLMVLARLRRSPLGGFGGMLPEPSAG